MKITFKRQPKATGLAAVGNPHPNTDIKMDGKLVGTIVPPNWRDNGKEWLIMVRLKKPLPLPAGENCTWYNAVLKPRFANEEAAREYATGNLPRIFQSLPPSPEE